MASALLLCAQLLLALAVATVGAGKEKDSCCWCGKKFVPKSGLWEGSGAKALKEGQQILPEKPKFFAFPSKSFYFDAEAASIIVRCMWPKCAQGLANQSTHKPLTLTAYSRKHTILDNAPLTFRHGASEASVSFDTARLVPQAQTDVHLVISQDKIPAPLHQQTLPISRVASAPAGSVRVDFRRGYIETPIPATELVKGGKRKWKGVLKPIGKPREMRPYFPYQPFFL